MLKEQLEHLVSASSRNRVQVRVVPLAAGLHIGLSGPFVLATLAGGGRVGYLDTQLRGTARTRPGRC